MMRSKLSTTYLYIAIAFTVIELLAGCGPASSNSTASDTAADVTGTITLTYSPAASLPVGNTITIIAADATNTGAIFTFTVASAATDTVGLVPTSTQARVYSAIPQTIRITVTEQGTGTSTTATVTFTASTSPTAAPTATPTAAPTATATPPAASSPPKVANIQFTSSAYNLGRLPLNVQSSTYTGTINNTGTGAANVTFSAVAGNGLVAVSGSSCSVAPGASCNFSFQILPASLGSHTFNIYASYAGSLTSETASLSIQYFGFHALMSQASLQPGNGRTAIATVQAFDFFSRQELLSVWPYGSSFTGGARVAICDVNGDGYDDVIAIAGPGGAPQVVIYDGSSWTQMASFYVPGLDSSTLRTGYFVACGQVVPGSSEKYIVAGVDSGGGPVIVVFDRYGNKVAGPYYAPYGAGFYGGVHVAVGNVLGNSDGTEDIVVAPGSGGGNLPVYVLNYGGQELGGYTPSMSTSIGAFVATMRNAPGTPDSIVLGAGEGGGPQIQVYDIANGQLTNNFFISGRTDYDGVYVGSVVGGYLLESIASVGEGWWGFPVSGNGYCPTGGYCPGGVIFNNLTAGTSIAGSRSL